MGTAGGMMRGLNIPGTPYGLCDLSFLSHSLFVCFAFYCVSLRVPWVVFRCGMFGCSGSSTGAQ
jgi:hypothetical protein